MERCSECGGLPKLVVKPESVYGKAGNGTVYRYQCPSCGFRTLSCTSGYNGLTGTTITDAEAKQIALGNWKRQLTAEDVYRQAQEAGRRWREEKETC